MAETTIEWTATRTPDGVSHPGFTFNPWIGCAKVAAGCAHCYAERDWDKRRGVAKWGPHGTRVVTSPANWRKPLAWNTKAAGDGIRRKVFCASLADVFEDFDGELTDHHGDVLMVCPECQWQGTLPIIVPQLAKRSNVMGCPQCDTDADMRFVTLDNIRRGLFALIDLTPHLDWLLCTKRPQNIRDMLPAVKVSSQQQADDLNERGELYRRNVWLLTSVSEQATLERNSDELAKCRDLSPVLGFSAEPLLGPLNFTFINARLFDWVICGGESGPGARPMHPDWARGLRDECAAAGVPFFFKQWGEYAPDELIDDRTFHRYRDRYTDGTCSPELMRYFDAKGQLLRAGDGCCEEGMTTMVRVGKKAAGRLLDGVTHDAMPAIS